jgi:TRAP-type uncharacterized transport system fused permease subunit
LINQKLSRGVDGVIYVLAFVMGIFQLASSIFRLLNPVIHQNLHLMFSLVLIFLIGFSKALKAEKPSVLKMLLMLSMLLMTLFATAYIHFNYATMVLRAGRSTQMDLFVAALLIIVVLMSTKMTLGSAIPILTIVAIIYMFVGPYMPGIFYHGGFSVKRVLSTLVTGFNGLYGTLLNTSATFIALFMILGGFLTKTVRANSLWSFPWPSAAGFVPAPAWPPLLQAV